MPGSGNYEIYETDLVIGSEGAGARAAVGAWPERFGI
jgi:hypothetical protein